MIRYIDIGDQITEGKSQFAWWDTGTNRFFELYGEQVWDTWADFERDFGPEKYLERFKGLFPKDKK